MGRVETPNYADENDVYMEVGIPKAAIVRITDLTDKEVTDLVNNYLKAAESKVRDLLGIPHIIPHERHLGTGEDDEFDLGPDDEEFYIDIDPEGCVEFIKWCYFGRSRRKRPYPKNCDTFTDKKSLWDSTIYTQPSNEPTIKQAGEYAMKFDWSGGVGTARYPDVTNGEYIDKNIDIFDFMFCRLRSDTAGITVTITLHSLSGETAVCTFTCTLANKWYMVMKDIDIDFTNSANLNWDSDNLGWITITVSDVCTLYVDNWNVNDGWCFTAPSGKLVIMHRSTDEPPHEGYPFFVTYTFDPFKVDVPQNIRSATAQYAGVKLLDKLIGIRQAFIGFEAETMQLIPEKEGMYARRGSLLAKAKENLRSYGYGWAGTVAQ